jgi:fructose-1,6-bisphosphatase/inositol monophosphatase family enzyme
MKQPGFGKAALAISVFTCATMFSFDWSEHKGASLSIERALARMGDPSTPTPGVTRRQARRTAAGAAAVGADAVAAGATAAYYGSGGGPYAYYADGGSAAYYGGPGVWSQDYAARNGIICQPGTMVRLDDGLMHRCQ